MPTRTARTAWTGTLEQGSGQVELTSSQIATYDVSFPKRAADDADGTTSPEELIAAAHSSCYAMSSDRPHRPRRRHARRPRRPGRRHARPRPGRRLPADRHRAHRPRRGGGPRRRRLRAGRPGRQGRLPGEQGPDRRRHHPGRRARGLTQTPPGAVGSGRRHRPRWAIGSRRCRWRSSTTTCRRPRTALAGISLRLSISESGQCAFCSPWKYHGDPLSASTSP